MQQEETIQTIAVPATGSGSTPPAASVSVRYEENRSKQWDGKIVKMDRAWLEAVCGSQDLLVGAAVDMPWRGKGGKTAIWKGVIVSDDYLPVDASARKSKLIYNYTCTCTV